MAKYIFNTEDHSFFIPKRDSYKLLANEIEITQECYEKIMENLNMGKIPLYTIKEDVLEVSFYDIPYEPTDDELRSRRDELLKAFDIYKTNVIYGILLETPEEKETIYNWYLGILNLSKESFMEDNIPNAIKYYL